ncbi:hypothetical protein DLAC_02958 [Tieghemostelium lacteum]|uniref:MACPF domain-containing protein n=1 Tax=Tieghemostelium lacteum TaxID=361077 RepID=A0A152A3U6_TIELA|nr:hypothetical protein DLAC_02958 [Tieghemostelium lacteum]|eukprot:KYR00896.1 hypothetical protein DLAC_02958 [Tieghemostelium lacteum]
MNSYYKTNIILTFLLVLFTGHLYTQTTSISSTCEVDCGAYLSPFKTLKSAFDQIKLSTTRTTILYIADSAYFLSVENKDLTISGLQTHLIIRSTSGTYSTSAPTFNGAWTSRFLTIVKSKVTFIGLQFGGYVANKGGAMYIDNSDVTIKNCIFLDNKAFIGATIYSTNSGLVIHSSTFLNNKATERGPLHLYKTNAIITDTEFHSSNTHIYGAESGVLSCESSSIQIDNPTTDNDGIALHCGLSCNIKVNQETVCNRPNVSSDEYETFQLLISRCGPEPLDYCGGCVSTVHNCLNCHECPCYQSGFAMEVRSNLDNCLLDSKIINFESNSEGDLFSNFARKEIRATLTGYMKVRKPKTYAFSTDISNAGVVIKLDRKILFSTQQQTSLSTSNLTHYLHPDTIYTIHIDITSAPIKGNQKRKFSFTSMDKDNVEIYFARGQCGDRVTQSPYDFVHPTCTIPTVVSSGPAVCGDGFCDEGNPNNCLKDCYHLLSEKCESRKVPSNHIPPGFFVEYTDTLGNLIDNQMIWHLPGSEHFQTGIDIVSGKAAKSPVFYFGYCSDESENFLQDVYRRSIYELPDELTGKILPQCTFSTSTTTYHTLESIRKETHDKSNLAFQVAAGASYGGYAASASAAYSKDTSIKKAQSITTESTSTYFVTEVECTMSSVEMVKTTFSPTFLEDLAKVSGTEEQAVNQMYQLIEKYGTHYIKSAQLGGSLKMITTTEEKMTSSEHESEWSESVERSASVNFRSPVLSGSASVSDTLDSTQSTAQQEEKETKSERTSVIVKGGAPGSYGPHSGSSGFMFEDWANSIDLLPVPLNEDLYPISSLFLPEWKLGSKTLKELWIQAEQQYYDVNQYSSTLPNKYAVYFEFESVDAGLAAMPILNIQWKSPSDGSMKNYVIRVGHKQVMGTNQESIEFIPNLSTPTAMYNRTRKSYYKYDSVMRLASPFNYNDINEGYVLVGEQYQTQAKSPLRYDVTFPEDFMTSTIQPVVTVTNFASYPSDKSATFRIVNLLTSKAIFINKDGFIPNDGFVHVLMSFQFLSYGGILGTPLLEYVQMLPQSNYNIGDLLNTMYGSGAANIEDKHEIIRGYEGSSLSFSQTYSFSKFLSTMTGGTIQYEKLMYLDTEPTKPLKFIYNQVDIVGSIKRINYLLAMRPIPGNTWLRNVYSYHCAQDGYHASPYSPKSYALNLTPIQPENSQIQYYARNTLRYLPLTPVEPNYLPIGKYPLENSKSHVQTCQTLFHGSFNDYSSLFANGDMNFTLTDHIHSGFFNLCGRSLTCVNADGNVYMDSELTSCVFGTTFFANSRKSDPVTFYYLTGGVQIVVPSSGLRYDCSTYTTTFYPMCDPAIDGEPVVTTFTTGACVRSVSFRTSLACQSPVSYDILNLYYYNLTNIQRDLGDYNIYKNVIRATDLVVLTNLTLYFNIAGQASICGYNVYNYPLQSCLIDGAGSTIAPLATLTGVFVEHTLDGSGLLLKYPIATGKQFQIYLTCDVSTLQAIDSVTQLPDGQYIAYIRTSEACGIPFNPNQPVPGLPTSFTDIVFPH